MSLTKDEPVTSEFKLDDRSNWPKQYSNLKWYVTTREVQHLINPEGEDTPNYVNKPPPKYLLVQKLYDNLDTRRSLARVNWRLVRDTIQVLGTDTLSLTPNT